MSLALRRSFVVYVALIAGCAAIDLQHPPATAPPFELAARIAVRHQDRAFSSALRWKQSAEGDELWFTSPLGQTLAYLHADAHGATLTSADQQQYHASSIESLTRSALGWPFPIGGMRYWVRGEMAPDMPGGASELDSAGRLARLKQGDWQVSFSYADAGATRPSRIDVAGRDAEIRLVIDDLTVPQT